MRNQSSAKPASLLLGTANKTVDVPTWLHELHGERSTWRDIVTVHLVAWVCAIGVFWLVGGPVGILLAILMVDIAGGVVANVTRGTNDYYARRRGHRIVFLSLHVIQPALLILLTPAPEALVIAVAAWTLLGASVLESLRRSGCELALTAPIALAWAVIGLASLLVSGGTAGIGLESIAAPLARAIDLLLILYMLKLLPAFSVDWYDAASRRTSSDDHSLQVRSG
jgi:hypothetical protein